MGVEIKVKFSFRFMVPFTLSERTLINMSSYDISRIYNVLSMLSDWHRLINGEGITKIRREG
ncbi:MAG: hypothetical protein NWE88_00400 [Candidatus Bathyarchaeota archaeon]|nr:hypothetical protein [Candidatus Bathyarchaeota archaeon]